ncbi:MAG: tetratricopeptide repeat protein, partial [Chloroflexota bacterium]|nr:tetratricopeptide repeat protein [Chloroflexota bacterium]
MAKTPLRSYILEIEAAIEENQTNEAIAHCRHILETFSKNVVAYRLLGKAYLESQRYGSATDIFQRVLSAIPDDFVSHLGMSIIREDEGNLDSALWHMRRSFDIQPYNAAIQSEIRRLYSNRDRIEPPKTRLTRGSLARMYNKGGQYQQAISELRAALAENPERPDLLVVLAEAYAKNNNPIKAVEVCSTLLKDLPYCMVANRLLSQLLKGTDRKNDRNTCQRRLQFLDPYEAHTSPKALTAADVPDQAVMIERLEWKMGADIAGGAESPEWASSLGVDLGESDSPEEGLPDWTSSTLEDGDSTPIAADGDDEENIPDWMKDAGWKTSTGEVEEAPSAISFDDDIEAEEDAIAADIPDWMKDMAPAGAAAEEASPESLEDIDSLFPDETQPEADDLPDWLHIAEESAPQPQAEAEAAPESTAAPMPEPAEAAAEADQAIAAPMPKPAAEAAEEDDIPDWLKDMEAEA